jgi:hypothetical protein
MASLMMLETLTMYTPPSGINAVFAVTKER